MPISVMSRLQGEPMTKTLRLTKVMDVLRRHTGPVTAQSLADDLLVSVRSIHRDIATLREMGAVIDGEAGFGFTLIEDNALPPMAFGDTELEALVLGLREVQQIADPDLAEAAQSALRKIQARLPDRQAQALRHSVLSARRFHPPERPTVNAADLRQATRDEYEITFDYCDAKGSKTARHVKPLGLVYFDRSTALVAWCTLRQADRVFRLDRMSQLTVLSTSFRPHRVAMLREALDKFCKLYPTKQAKVLSSSQ